MSEISNVMETVSPNIYVNDIKATIAFYELLGFATITTVPDANGDPLFALMMNGAVTFMFQTFKSIQNLLPAVSRNSGGSLMLYVKIKGVRQFHDSIKHKVEVVHGIETTFYGATEFSIVDNNNYLITFAEDEHVAS